MTAVIPVSLPFACRGPAREVRGVAGRRSGTRTSSAPDTQPVAVDDDEQLAEARVVCADVAARLEPDDVDVRRARCPIRAERCWRRVRRTSRSRGRPWRRTGGSARRSRSHCGSRAAGADAEHEKTPVGTPGPGGYPWRSLTGAAGGPSTPCGGRRPGPAPKNTRDSLRAKRCEARNPRITLEFVTHTPPAPGPRPTRHPFAADSASGGALPATDDRGARPRFAQGRSERAARTGRRVPIAFRRGDPPDPTAHPRRSAGGVPGKAGLRGDPRTGRPGRRGARCRRPGSSSRSIGPDRCTGICAWSTMASSRRGRCRRASRPIPAAITWRSTPRTIRSST